RSGGTRRADAIRRGPSVRADGVRRGWADPVHSSYTSRVADGKGKGPGSCCPSRALRWLRGSDLNRRPLGYELIAARETRRDQDKRDKATRAYARRAGSQLTPSRPWSYTLRTQQSHSGPSCFIALATPT